MAIYSLNPLDDPRWQSFVDGHPRASAFHTREWLEALHRTYGYEPVVYTTTLPGMALANGIAFCRISSWVSGTRLVSLPFSDHCDPLAEPREVAELVHGITASSARKPWKYIELRPAPGYQAAPLADFVNSESFALQTLDLRPDLYTLFQNFHKSCVQRKIRKAERENLRYEEGRSESLLRKFYHLLLLTRRRHGLPPQPLAWFRNVLGCLGNRVSIRVASKNDQPIASIITIQYKQTLIYKYGCSDSAFNNLGGNSLLFWRSIQDAKRDALVTFDLGRSELDNLGLTTFKENLGAASKPLNYYRLPSSSVAHLRSPLRSRLAKGVFSLMPDPLFAATGRLLYRHIG